MTEETSPEAGIKVKARLSQSDVPGYALEDAIKIARTLNDHYGKQPTRPLMVAKGLGVSPTTGPFRMLTGASAAYELTEGAANSSNISLTPLGRRVVAPTVEGDDLGALREAVLKPRIMREFLSRYDGNKLPAEAIAQNVLEEMGVPAKATERAYKLILENAQFVGFMEEVKGNKYINMNPVGSKRSESQLESSETDEDSSELIELLEGSADTNKVNGQIEQSKVVTNTLATNKRVFISHGKNKEIVEQLRELLNFGGFEAIVSVDRETTATPVPDKVMDDMRSCGAGIVNVGTDKTIKDENGTEHKMLNENVLIEIGASLALYRRNFILLVEEGVQLPSNLQGLYEVRYSGKSLDNPATMKLLRSFNEFKENAEE